MTNGHLPGFQFLGIKSILDSLNVTFAHHFGDKLDLPFTRNMGFNVSRNINGLKKVSFYRKRRQLLVAHLRWLLLISRSTMLVGSDSISYPINGTINHE
jgi:hypothetical protein